MPPIGCLPLFRAADLAAGGTGECNGQLTALAKLHNVLLSKKLEHLQKQLKGFRYSYFDIFTAAVEMFDNPSKYGTCNPLYFLLVLVLQL